MNTIEHAKVFQQELDKAMLADLCTGWMDENSKTAKYEGGSEIKIPKLVMSGLGDYNRINGYPEGDISLTFETMTMTKDRGRSFNIDAMDVDESGFVLVASDVMGEFQRTHVVPETDAYRIGKINTLAGARARAYTPVVATVLQNLKQDIATVQDAIGDVEPLVVLMSFPVAAILDSNENISKQLNVGDFKKGEVTMKVKMLDEVPILRVPSSRMKSAFVFYDGVTDSDGASQNPTPDQRTGGFVPASGAVAINWIVCAKRAPIGVSKTDTVRIFDPLTYQKANAWHIDYRKYHDLWIPDNKLNGVFVNRAS